MRIIKKENRSSSQNREIDEALAKTEDLAEESSESEEEKQSEEENKQLHDSIYQAADEDEEYMRKYQSSVSKI